MHTEVNLAPDVERALAHHDAKLEDRKLGFQQRKNNDLNEGLATTFDDFLKYIVALLETQTPDKPVDPKEMAEFFLMFGNTQSIKQQTELIGEMKESYDNSQVMLAASQVGKVAQVKSNTFEYDPDERNSITYDLPAGVKDVQIVISKIEQRKGDNGEMMANDMGVKLTQVAAFSPPKFNGGKNDFVWDGKIPDKSRAGKYTDAEQGTYHINIIAKGEDGKEFYDDFNKRVQQVPVWVTGVVTGAAKDGGQPCIKIGNSKHSMEDVVGFEARKGVAGMGTEGYDSGTVKELYRHWDNERTTAESDFHKMRTNLAHLDLHGL